jgi:hypothetical protein
MFDLKIVFIKNFLKIAPTRVRFSPGSPPGAGLPGGAIFWEFSEAPAEMRTTLEQPQFTYADLFRAGLPGGAIFLSRFRKGSKSFQTLLNTGGVSDRIQVKCFTSFCRAAELVPVPFALPFTEVELSFFKRGDCLALWAAVPMNNRFRDFLFKFLTNRLSTGARIGHFNNNIDESCFHCRLEKKFPAPRETFSHMFFDCPVP